MNPKQIEISFTHGLGDCVHFGANAITINCLGGFYGGHIHAYPCLGFHELCNEGLVGACEADVTSTVTQLVMAAMTSGRTGFISDPVFDTARRQIVYAHCVAPNRAFGPEGEENPYDILTHSEHRQGASLRSVLPEGYMTTTLEVKETGILFHQAKAGGTIPTTGPAGRSSAGSLSGTSRSS